MTNFIVVGNTNAVTYKEVFPLIKDNKVRLGYNHIKMFCTGGIGLQPINNVVWYSTYPVDGKPVLTLTKTYDPALYPKYDNYDAIEVSRIKDIPYDYDGVMGVPVTILNYDLTDIEIIQAGGDDLPKDLFNECLSQGHKTHYGKPLLIYRKGEKLFIPYNRIMIRIIGIATESGDGEGFIRGKETYVDEKHKRSTAMVLNNKRVYARILIRRKNYD